MPKLTMFRGVSASGKSTEAKRIASESKGSVVRVNKDDIRAHCYGGFWSRENEAMVKSIEEAMVRRSLEAGKDVIVDSTNIGGGHEERFRQMADAINGAFSDPKSTVEFSVREFHLPFDECVERDAMRGDASVGAKVIRRQWESMYGRPPEREPRAVPMRTGIRKAIVCDIDGTVADHFGRRSPYEYEKVGLDGLHEDVKSTVQALSAWESARVVFVSGREDSCRVATERWLREVGSFSSPEVHMRATGDKRPDDVVKREIYMNEIAPLYDVVAVFDDRDRVVRMWRSLGLRCYQVAPGNF